MGREYSPKSSFSCGHLLSTDDVTSGVLTSLLWCLTFLEKVKKGKVDIAAANFVCKNKEFYMFKYVTKIVKRNVKVLARGCLVARGG